ncbi:MAG: hypothetical protein CMH83_07880 [Nocardioides sp.]|nr:hypothetical protein [Nocardioides sp.]
MSSRTLLLLARTRIALLVAGRPVARPARAPARPVVRRPGRVVAVPVLLAAVSVLAACGDEDPAPDVATTASESPAEASTSDAPDGTDEGEDGDLGADAVLLHAPNGGGSVQPSLVWVSEEAEAQTFVSDLSDEAFRAEVLAAIEAARADGVDVWAGIVAVGCDVPASVRVTPGEAGLEVEPVLAGKPSTECFVPHTTVAVVPVEV